MGRARVQTAQAEEENKEIAENLEAVEVPENAEMISEEEARELEEKAIAKVEKEAAEEEVKEEFKEEVKHVKYLIHTPNESYSGLNCGVEFKQGKGYTANKVIAEMFIEKGYEVEEIK